MSAITVKPSEPYTPPKPRTAYPPWMLDRMANNQVAVPPALIAAYAPQIEPYMTQVRNVKTFTVEKGIPKPLQPLSVVQTAPLVSVKYKVLNVQDAPITGFVIRSNNDDLLTDSRGEATTNIYKGHDVTFSSGAASGWCVLSGSRRRSRMAGLIPLGNTVKITKPTTIYLYPESGTYRINGTLYESPPRYSPKF